MIFVRCNLNVRSSVEPTGPLALGDDDAVRPHPTKGSEHSPCGPEVFCPPCPCPWTWLRLLESQPTMGMGWTGPNIVKHRKHQYELWFTPI